MNPVLTVLESHRSVLPCFISSYCLLREDSSFTSFEDHLRTNTVGPIIVAQKLLHIGIPIGTIIFMSSDSGSTTEFRAFEDGCVNINLNRHRF